MLNANQNLSCTLQGLCNINRETWTTHNAIFYTFPTHWCHNVKCHVEVVGGLTRAGTEAIPWLLLQQNTTLLPTPSPIKSWSWYCCTIAQPSPLNQDTMKPGPSYKPAIYTEKMASTKGMNPKSISRHVIGQWLHWLKVETIHLM